MCQWSTATTTDGLRSDRAWLVDWEHPENNDLAAINQFTIEGPKRTRRPDVLLFVNGLPLAIFELKRPGKAYARVAGAYRQVQTYRSQIPEVFKWNQVAVVSDGSRRGQDRSRRRGITGRRGRRSTGHGETRKMPTAIASRRSRS